MPVIVNDHDGVRLVVIDRPERRNALDPETFSGIGRAFSAAADDPSIRVVIITGSGDQAFCAGMDLKAFAQGHDGPAATGPGLEVLTESFFPKPVIAAVNGAAVGGGLGIVLACDIVVAAPHAVFAIPEVQRGLVGAGVSSRAALRLPPAIAAEMALTGEPIDAARAHELGIVNRIAPAGELLDVARAIAARIAANAPLAVGAAKRIIHEVRPMSAGLDMAALRAIAAPVIASDDAREGARAFAEKRPPTFTGL